MLQHPTIWFDWKQLKYPSKELLLYDVLHKKSTDVWKIVTNSACRPMYQETSEKSSLVILEIDLTSKLLWYVPLISWTLWKVSYWTVWNFKVAPYPKLVSLDTFISRKVTNIECGAEMNCIDHSLEPGPSRARYFPRDMLLLTTTARERLPSEGVRKFSKCLPAFPYAWSFLKRTTFTVRCCSRSFGLRLCDSFRPLRKLSDIDAPACAQRLHVHTHQYPTHSTHAYTLWKRAVCPPAQTIYLSAAFTSPSKSWKSSR